MLTEFKVLVSRGTQTDYMRTSSPAALEICPFDFGPTSPVPFIDPAYQVQPTEEPQPQVEPGPATLAGIDWLFCETEQDMEVELPSEIKLPSELPGDDFPTEGDCCLEADPAFEDGLPSEADPPSEGYLFSEADPPSEAEPYDAADDTYYPSEEDSINRFALLDILQ
ncbi:cell surface glycoprotein 1 [Ixodes scapularis]